MRVLSLGYTRSLWDSRESNDNVRLRHYARGVELYTVIVVSRKHHKLRELQLAENFRCIPTSGLTPIDNFVRLVRYASSELHSRRYDILQVQDPCYTGLAGLIAKGSALNPVLNVCVYGSDPFDRHWQRSSISARLLAPIGRYVLRHCEGIQVDGLQNARSLVKNGILAERIVRKPMLPVDIESFFALSVARRYNESVKRPLQILYVGRLATQKNLPLAFESIKQLDALFSERFTFEVLGDGPCRGELEKQAKQLGLTHCVNFHGSCDRHDVLKAAQLADVFLLTSAYEGYPRVLLEAAAAGLPIVTTEVSGAGELVSDGNTGFIVPRGDSSIIAERLFKLLTNRELRQRMGDQARAHAKNIAAVSANPARQLEIWQDLQRRFSGAA